MNRTTTVLVALIAAAGLSTMAYTIPEQRALAWGSFGGFGGCGFGFGGCGGFFTSGCGFGCGGFFGFHKFIIQTISQTNTCRGNGDDQKAYSKGDEDQRDKQTLCINTAVNHAGPGFVTMPSIPSIPSIPSMPSHPPDNDGHKQPGKEVAIGGNGGSGGTGGSGGEGGQGGKNVGDITKTSNTNVNQKANGGNSNGGHAGNANGGNATT